MKSFFVATLILAGWLATSIPSYAGIVLAGGVFSGRIDRWDTSSNTVSTFSDLQAATGGATAIAGMAYNPISNRIIVADRLNNRIYELNASTGSLIAQHTSSSLALPVGIAVDATGNIYVANAGGNSISKFNSDFTSETSITIPDFGVGTQNAPSGLAINGAGNLLVSTSLGFIGTLQYDPSNGNFSSFNSSKPLANALIAVSGDGTVYIGSSNIGFGNAGTDVTIFDASGNATGSIAIDETLLPEPSQPYTSLDFTNPSGVAVDGSGNLIVGALGRTNPFSADDNFQSNGGLFLFDSNGNLVTSLVQTTPYISVLDYSAVPEPTSLMALGFAVTGIALARRIRKRTNSLPTSTATN